MYRTSIRLPQRCTQRDNRNSLVFAPNAIALVRARFLQQSMKGISQLLYDQEEHFATLKAFCAVSAGQ